MNIIVECNKLAQQLWISSDAHMVTGVTFDVRENECTATAYSAKHGGNHEHEKSLSATVDVSVFAEEAQRRSGPRDEEFISASQRKAALALYERLREALGTQAKGMVDHGDVR